MKILMPTHSRNERYLPACFASLGHFWPGHPELFVFTDTGAFEHPGTFVSPGTDWAAMMADCLRSGIESGRLSREEVVLLLLEDHIPHRKVDDVKLRWLAEVMRQRGMDYLGLFDVTRFGTGCFELVAAEPGGGPGIHRFELPNFSSLHPALWSVGHLENTLQLSLESGQTSPWRFEYLRFPGKQHHIVGSEVWPSPHGGFLFQGRVNTLALSSMDQGPMRALRRRLLVRLAFEVPGRVVRRIRRREWRVGRR